MKACCQISTMQQLVCCTLQLLPVYSPTVADVVGASAEYGELTVKS